MVTLHKIMAKASKKTHESLQSTIKPNSLGEEEEIQGLHTINGHSQKPFVPPPCHPSVSNYKVTYSLSSAAHLTNSIASSRTRSRSRSRSRSRPISQGTSSFMSSPSQFTSLCDDDAETAHLELPPIHPSDYMKTLLSQLAASISAMKTAYAHQQAALNPYNKQRVCGRDRDAVGDADVVSAADKAMVQELERLSQLHVQLSVLPHILQQCEKSRCSEVAEFHEEMTKDHEMEDSMSMLKRYEGIITRFYDEMRRKDAVAAALKETLAKSMLQGEKLERRVKAFEAASSSCVKGLPNGLVS